MQLRCGIMRPSKGGPSEPHAITTQRINIGEPKRNSSNGDLKSHPTSRRDRQGTEQPKVDRPQAGMIFYNDEGSENGV